jgi:hypothetical protein
MLKWGRRPTRSLPISSAPLHVLPIPFETVYNDIESNRFGTYGARLWTSESDTHFLLTVNEFSHSFVMIAEKVSNTGG